MLNLKDVIDEKALSSIQELISDVVKTSFSIYDSLGSCLFSIRFSPYCKYLHNKPEVKSLSTASSETNTSCTCEYSQLVKRVINNAQEEELLIDCGIRILGIPILYRNKAVGAIVSGISNPSASTESIRRVSKKYSVDSDELLNSTLLHQKGFRQISKYVIPQLKLIAMQIASMYEAQTHSLEKNSLLEAVVNNITEGIIICDKDGNYINWNKGAQVIFPFAYNVNKAGECANYSKMYSEDGVFIPPNRYPMMHILKGESIKDFVGIIEYSDPSLDKKYLLFNGSPIFDAKQTLAYGVLTFSDITELKKQSNNIEEQLHFFESAISKLDTPVFFVKYPDLQYKYVNAKHIALLKKVAETSSSGEMPSYFSCLNLLDILNEVGRQKRHVHIEKVEYTAGDESGYFNCLFTPLINTSGEVAYILVICFDITPQVTYSARLEEISRLKEEFFANMSHEFRTPLNVILSALQILLNQSSFNQSASSCDSSSKYLSIIKNNSYRLLRLINNLLFTTQIDSGYMQLFLEDYDIVSIVNGIYLSVLDFAEQNQIKLIFQSDIKEKVVAVDLDKLERILLNLLSNAIKFTGKGGQIIIRISSTKDFLEISIEDTGIGIPRQKISEIFNRFSQVDNSLTRRHEGSGIGLSLVKSLVEMHDGVIRVRSRIGKGSKFIIKLPYRTSGNRPSKSFEPQLHNISDYINIEFSDILTNVKSNLNSIK